jgi:hypothetical protein
MDVDQKKVSFFLRGVTFSWVYRVDSSWYNALIAA